MPKPSETNLPKLCSGASREGPIGESESVRKFNFFQTSRIEIFKAVIARGIHLFPFRTEKLSPVTPMVLRKWESR